MRRRGKRVSEEKREDGGREEREEDGGREEEEESENMKKWPQYRGGEKVRGETKRRMGGEGSRREEGGEERARKYVTDLKVDSIKGHGISGLLDRSELKVKKQ